MKRIEQIPLRDFSERQQRVVDRLCSDLPDRMVVHVTNIALWCSWRGWLPALTRHNFSVAFPIPFDWALVDLGFEEEAWRAIASPRLKSDFRRWRADQQARHASAAAPGLVRPDGGLDDLDRGRMAIDRTLRHVLEADGVDVRAAASAAGAGADASVQVFEAEAIVVRRGDYYLEITHDGEGPPNISTAIPLGPGFYVGRQLHLPGHLPATLVASAPGRRLGSIVATGWATIDARRIERVELDGRVDQGPRYPWNEPRTRFVLERDEVARERWRCVSD